MQFVAEILLVLICICSHILVLTLLSIRRSQQPPHRTSSKSSTCLALIDVNTVRCIGLLSAIFTLAIPYAVSIHDPLMQAGCRCICFFYACKLLDLSMARVVPPPTCMEDDNSSKDSRDPAPMHSLSDHFEYVFRLLTEMRYQSFDIAIKQTGRPNSDGDKLNSTWSWLPLFLIPGLAILIPTPETKCLLLLLIIQVGLETLHTIFHLRRSSCNQPLFYKPFAAASFTSFWATHWHAGAAPFLNSLAYRPGKRYVGKWFGVLATFNLTGIWHAWAAAPVVESDYAKLLALKVWAMFMVMGLGILAEQCMGLNKTGGLLQRLVVWSIATLSAGWAFRTLECHTTINWLRNYHC